MKETRSFISINIGEKIRQQLKKLQAELMEPHAHVRWVDPHTMHLTLAFLGNIPEDTIPNLIKKLDENLINAPAFKLTVKGVGTFGRKSRPTVVWAGIDDIPALQHLCQQTLRSIQDAGLEADSKPFHPHLTLGRVKSLQGIDQLQQAIEEKHDTEFGTIEVKSVYLMKSTLTPEGAVYSILHSVALG